MANCVTGTPGRPAGIPSRRVVQNAAPKTPKATRVMQMIRSRLRQTSCRTVRGWVHKGRRYREVCRVRDGDVNKGAGPWAYKYRLAAPSFIHKTEIYGQDWDTRSWNLIVVVLLLGGCEIRFIFFRKVFGRILLDNSTFYFGGSTYFFFRLYYSLLPRGTRRTRGGDRTRSRFCTAGQRFPPLGERSPLAPGFYGT